MGLVGCGPQPEAEQVLPTGGFWAHRPRACRVSAGWQGSQVQQHQVVAVGPVRIGGLMLLEAQLELRVWEALRDLDELCGVFLLRQGGET